MAAINAVDVSDCVHPGGPSGAARVAVTFDPDGTISSAAVVEPLLIGTAVGECLSRKFRDARLPAFAGSPVKFETRFLLATKGS
jgi:hypothetical protein